MTRLSAREKLKRWRGKRTFAAAAVILETTRSYVHHLESGKKTPGLMVAARIERETGIAASEWAAKERAR